jgi:hypothetical protein
MAKDAVATMGATLPDDVGGRDAVHVAVFSAVCASKVFPGQDIAINSHGERDATVTPGASDCVAIVDPFLRAAVPPGERFWAYLYPRTITALSHRWSHPAFEGRTDAAYVPPSDKLKSEDWLRDFVEKSDCPDYHRVMVLAEQFLDDPSDNDETLHVSGTSAAGLIPDEFWYHAGVVLGRKIPKRTPTYFSCSC